MAHKAKPYTEEFKRQIIELHNAGTPVAKLAAIRASAGLFPKEKKKNSILITVFYSSFMTIHSVFKKAA